MPKVRERKPTKMISKFLAHVTAWMKVHFSEMGNSEEGAHSGYCRWIRSPLLDKLSFRSYLQELSAVRWTSEGAAQSNDG